MNNNITYFQDCKGDLNVPAYRKKCYSEMEKRMESVMDRYVRNATEEERNRQHAQCMLLRKLDAEFYKEIHNMSRDMVESVLRTLGVDTSTYAAEDWDAVMDASKFKTRCERLRNVRNRQRLDADTMEYCAFLSQDYTTRRPKVREYIEGMCSFDDPELQAEIKDAMRAHANAAKNKNKEDDPANVYKNSLSSYENVFSIFNDILQNTEHVLQPECTYNEFVRVINDDRYILEKYATRSHDVLLQWVMYWSKDPYDEDNKMYLTFVKDTLSHLTEFRKLWPEVSKQLGHANTNTTNRNHTNDIVLDEYDTELFEPAYVSDSPIVRIEKDVLTRLQQQNTLTNTPTNARCKNDMWLLQYDDFMQMTSALGATRRNFEQLTNTSPKNLQKFGAMRIIAPFYTTPTELYPLGKAFYMSADYRDSRTHDRVLSGYLKDYYKSEETINDMYKSMSRRERYSVFNLVYLSTDESTSQTQALCTAFRGIGSEDVLFYKCKVSSNHNLIHSHRDRPFVAHVLRVFNAVLRAPNSEERTKRLIFLFYYLFCNWMPYARGSAAIGKFLLRYLLHKKGFAMLRENTTDTTVYFKVFGNDQYMSLNTLRVRQHFPSAQNKPFYVCKLSYAENKAHAIQVSYNRNINFAYYQDKSNIYNVNEGFRNFSANADVLAILIDDFDLFYRLMTEKFHVPGVIHVVSNAFVENKMT